MRMLVEPFVMIPATPQLSSALPRPRSGCVESMGDRLRRIPARTREVYPSDMPPILARLEPSHVYII